MGPEVQLSVLCIRTTLQQLSNHQGRVRESLHPHQGLRKNVHILLLRTIQIEENYQSIAVTLRNK